jgi:hypothetical protein
MGVLILAFSEESFYPGFAKRLQSRATIPALLSVSSLQGDHTFEEIQ